MIILAVLRELPQGETLSIRCVGTVHDRDVELYCVNDGGWWHIFICCVSS